MEQHSKESSIMTMDYGKIEKQQPAIYMMKITDADNFSESYCRAHFPERYAKALRFRFRDDRTRCLCAGVLVHEILRLEESDIRYNEYGKPYSDSAPGFSLSHSGKYVALAVGPALVGVDIEQTGKDCLNLMPRICTDDEIRWVGNDKIRFYTLWTLKESLSKAVGTGLSIEMKELYVLPLLCGGTVSCQRRNWYGSSQSIDGGLYILSFVSETMETPRIIPFT